MKTDRMGHKRGRPWFFEAKGPYRGNEPCSVDPGQLGWTTQLEAQWITIREELISLIEDNQNSLNTSKPYKTYEMLAWGIECENKSGQCPRTREIIRGIPGVIGASFVALDSGATIKPQGETTALIRCYLSLVAPAPLPQCGVRVGNETKQWNEGQLLIFGNAHNRTEWNNSTGTLYVLALDILKPEYASMTGSICGRILAATYLENAYERTQWLRHFEPIKSVLLNLVQPLFYLALRAHLPIARLRRRSAPVFSRPRVDGGWKKAMQDCSSYYCIIGAGPGGLGIARGLAKAGVPYEQLEADTDIGGNWRHGVYETTHIISSKKTTEYGDFPMPENYPDFPSAEQMLAYLCSYAEHFRLRDRIQFRTKVVFCRPLPDHRWEVELDSGETRIYRGLIVCNGHHWDCRWPSYPGTFAGQYIHAKQYKSPEQLRGKRVLVIGGGNSACDIASEAARVGKATCMSMRRGYWFLPKTILGRPLLECLPGWMPLWMQRIMLRTLLRLIVGDYRNYGLPRPDHRIFEAHPTVNIEVLHFIRHGRIRPKPDIARFEGTIVEFTDGSKEEFDLVVAATGYHVSFPFLPKGLVPVKDGLALLYAECLLSDFKNLYIIGTGQLRYGFGPLLTPAGDLIAQMIQLQEKMELPLGLVLRESGARLSNTHLTNPHESLRSMRIAKHTLPLLLGRERLLRQRIATPTPPVYAPGEPSPLEVH